MESCSNASRRSQLCISPNCVARKIADTGRDARPYEPAASAASPMQTPAAPRGRREPPRAADASRPALLSAPRHRCRACKPGQRTTRNRRYGLAAAGRWADRAPLFRGPCSCAGRAGPLARAGAAPLRDTRRGAVPRYNHIIIKGPRAGAVRRRGKCPACRTKGGRSAQPAPVVIRAAIRGIESP